MAHEVVVVGGGIAGVSVAHFLVHRGVTDVVVVERESQPAYHTTGRSAAVLHQIDANATLTALKVIGGAFLRRPPDGFTDVPLLHETGTLSLFTAAGWPAAQAAEPAWRAAVPSVRLWSPQQAAAHVPVLDPRAFAGASFTPDDGAIDVHALLSAYLHHATRGGAQLRCDTEVTGVLVEGGRCAGVVTAGGELRARWVVDAAGAWANPIARMAGGAPIVIQPRRRCAVVFEPPPGVSPAGWPLVACDERRVYFEPESGGILMSPMDEHPVAPCDARPDELTIAAGLERLAELAPALRPRSLRRRWAGLRSFAADRVPVVGEDPLVPGLFWLAGQGGCGIETSPALGAIAADLMVDGATDRFDAALLAPARLLA